MVEQIQSEESDDDDSSSEEETPVKNNPSNRDSRCVRVRVCARVRVSECVSL